jgi:hypothetical protein
MIKKLIMIAALTLGFTAGAAEIPIRGMVTSKCIINVDTPGIYGNPTPEILSTFVADGGRPAVVRYDVIQAGYYKAVITTPDNFTTSPTLDDSVTWSSNVDVSKVTNASMSAYTTSKRVYNNNVTEIDLTVQGTVWFSATSKAQYGFGKSFPMGEYKSVVLAQCIAL